MFCDMKIEKGINTGGISYYERLNERAHIEFSQKREAAIESPIFSRKIMFF